MAGATYRTKVEGLWVFQFAVPADCREELHRRFPDEYRGTATIRRSLGTGNAREAEVKVRDYVDKWRARIAAIRGPGDPAKLTALQRAAIEELRDLGYSISLTRDPDEDGAVPAPPAESARVFREMERQHAERRYSVAKATLSAKLRAAGLGNVDPDAALADTNRAISARLNAVERAAAVLIGDSGTMGAPGALTTLDGVLERWKREARPTASSVKECEYSVRRWRELHGPAPISQVTKPMVREFRDAMLETPTRINNADAAMPLPDLLKKYSGKDVERASVASARKRLSFIKTLLTTAVDAGIIAESPAEGVRIKDDGAKPDRARRAFTYAELEIITAELVSKKGEGFRWVTILGMTTGCRLGELVQLTAADVQEEDGVGFLSINAADGKAIKNASSVRRVPLHPAIREAFLAYCEGRSGRLFPDVRASKGGDPTDLFSKNWNYWRRGIGLGGQGLCFHSLRHSFKDRCREAGIAEEIHDALTGHSGGGVGRSYGGRPPLRVLAAAVEKLRFPTKSV